MGGALAAAVQAASCWCFRRASGSVPYDAVQSDQVGTGRPTQATSGSRAVRREQVAPHWDSDQAGAAAHSWHATTAMEEGREGGGYTPRTGKTRG